MQDLIEKVRRFGKSRATLIGDFMLDRYVYGESRGSTRSSRARRAGGTQGQQRRRRSRVAAAVPAMRCECSCVGVTGKEAEGDELLDLLSKAGAKTKSLMRLGDRPTAVKTRYIGLAQHRHAQQMLRVDEETVEPLPRKVQDMLRAAVRTDLAESDILIVEDYNKGVLTDELTPR